MAARSSNVWVVWLTFALALLLSVSSMPKFMELGRPLWLALFLTYWVLALPHRVGMTTAWGLGLLADVLNGSLFGQNALILTLITFLVHPTFKNKWVAKLLLETKSLKCKIFLVTCST